jgi:SAM-dependent methyltransferase
MSRIATKEEVEEFLAVTQFSRYQSVPLPHGLRTPGRDPAKALDLILGDRVRGKSVLDVGTYYGLFLYEALRRGASKAVGLEPDPERYEIASRIADIWGKRYRILNGTVDSVAMEERFDVVLFLNVLHHVPDPIFTVKRLTELCRDTLIVEFCLVDDPRYLQHLYGDPETPTLLARARAVLRSLILRCIGAGLPLMAVGNREYHRTFYCSPAAFRNLFMVHHKFFDAIQFIRSGQRTSHRAIAVCRVARRQTRTMGYEAETI